MKTLIYYCEIVKCIPQGKKDPKLKYCEGWHDFKGMGISLIGAWISWENTIKLFPRQAFENFQAIADEAELIIGFNSISFDDKLCNANGISIKTHYDLLQEIWWAAGMPREYTSGITRAGYKLDNLAHANLGRGKSGSGELAPVLWQQGKFWSVADYLTDDILITKEIWEKRSDLIDPTDLRVHLKLREPHEPLNTRHDLEKLYEKSESLVYDANVDDIPF